MFSRVSLSVLVLLLAFVVIGPAAAYDPVEQGNYPTTTTAEQGSPVLPPLFSPTAEPEPPFRIEPTPEPVSTPVIAPIVEPATPPASVPSTEPTTPAKLDALRSSTPLEVPTAEPVLPSPDAKAPESAPPAKKDPIPSVIPFDVDLAPGPGQPTIEVPEDPCLPGLYKDWQEMSVDSQERRPRNGFSHHRIIIDRSSFQLVLEGVRKDDTVEEIYRTHVGLGDVSSPTPEGNFVINHIYCYPDVVYFDASAKKVPGLYNGFFAPLLLCEDRKRCRRYHDLGIHGFQGAAARRHNVAVASTATYGAISAGCIRVPNPCKLKSELIRLVGIGPVKRNDRGTYHWLSRPVEVVITGYYPGTEDQTTLVSIFEQSLEQVHGGLKDLLGIFGR